MITPEVLKLANLGEKLAKLDGLISGAATRRRSCALFDASVVRVCEGAKIHIISQLNCRRLAVASDELGAKSLAAKLKSWGLRVRHLPYRDDMLMVRKGASRANSIERMLALADIADGSADVIVTSADSLLQKFPTRALVNKFTVRVSEEDIVSPVELADRLALAGYKRQEMIGEIGDFSLRGDILDVYSTDKTAYRINFFDDLVEEIKIIDPETMLSSNKVGSVRFAPADEILLDERELSSARAAIGKHINEKNAAQTLSALHEGACDLSAIWALPFIEGGMQSLPEYFNEEDRGLIIFDEPKVVWEKLCILQKEFEGRISSLTQAGEIVEAHRDVYITLHELKRQLLLSSKMSFSSLELGNPIFSPAYTVQPMTKPVTKYYLDPPSIGRDIKTFILNGAKVILACGSRERAKSVVDGLSEYDIGAQFSEDGNGAAQVLATPLEVETGVIYPASKVALIGVSECVGKRRADSIVAPKTKFTAPKAGDYVVHRVHGIGICEGTTLMKTGEFEREYIVLRYRDGDVLYVATDQMNNLQKFVGEEHPPLNKLGGKEFEREKEKVRKSVRKLAINLVELYAKREKQKGFTYSEDTVWQKEFEDAFEYEETADQLKAIADIKEDMERGRIMDRLLVGDVGFGKTEVAFRAMFKTVIDGKQAALLAPTTILARQHYENLAARLTPFGIKCGLLTRLQKEAENKKITDGLKDGTVHMVIATHKLLSKEVEFKDLGLLVLDEEQRFGVEHKEKLKVKYPLVNVLTLSATPIPRTLNMSLTGVRDISMLETAPRGRLPIQTYVVGYSDALLADAVTREMARGGQTFVLLNDISRLDAFARTVEKLCEGARVITAHGQMPPYQLEARMSAFYEKQYDVLVATTIIENGIDLPDANTLIVIDSGNFGLSQLYQLRGRVGRRGELAHAYFTVPENGTLTDTAEKRLKTLLDNTEIGSGFRVALSDLSIRGAGSLLGAEQSGHIEKVGYEMYLELLDEAVKEIRTGVVQKPARDTEMRVDAAAFIREGYVSSRDKLRIYKRISEIGSKSARDSLISELSEVYGQVDLQLENLINIALLKNLASRFDVSRIVINKLGAGANFYDSDIFKNEVLMRAVAEHSGNAVLTTTIPPTLIFEANGKTAEQKLGLMIDFFSSAV